MTGASDAALLADVASSTSVRDLDDSTLDALLTTSSATPDAEESS